MPIFDNCLDSLLVDLISAAYAGLYKSNRRAGRRHHNAPMIEGRWNVPPRWFCAITWIPVVLLTVPATFVLASWLFSPDRHMDGPFTRLVVGGTLAILAARAAQLAWWITSSRWRVGRLTSTAALAEELNVPLMRVRAFARHHDVWPHCFVNGEEFYDLHDFPTEALLASEKRQEDSVPQPLT